MRKTIITAVVTVLLIEVLAFLVAFNPSGFDNGGFGIVNVLFTLVTFIIGLISTVANKTSQIAKGVLIASGILLIVGISVCSNSNGIG